jgi:hypothetical protein
MQHCRQCLRNFAACPRPLQAERATHLAVILYTRKLQLLASRTTYHSMSLLLYYETPPNSACYEAARMESEAGARMTKFISKVGALMLPAGVCCQTAGNSTFGRFLDLLHVRDKRCRTRFDMHINMQVDYIRLGKLFCLQTLFC